ncbi:MAG: precorrin-8X methylmutase [Deltaproteobacteria bacterium]|nr:precorrin-8X methylmutase [Deltaproteobacteria bacterium]
MTPNEIEAQSFTIIDTEAGHHAFSSDEWQIVRRMIHTSADFDYMKTVWFHPNAIAKGIEAIGKGKTIITDTTMARSGINAPALARFGCRVICLIQDPDVCRSAQSAGNTRSAAAVDAALAEMEDGIYVVGNAPTALLRLIALIKAGRAHPALVIGLPVGFVNAAESKADLMAMDYPGISNQGRKGGSTVAACVVNALVKLTTAKLS